MQADGAYFLGTLAGGFITTFVLPLVALRVAGMPTHRLTSFATGLRISAVAVAAALATASGNPGAWLAVGAAALWAGVQHLYRDHSPAD